MLERQKTRIENLLCMTFIINCMGVTDRSLETQTSLNIKKRYFVVLALFKLTIWIYEYTKHYWNLKIESIFKPVCGIES